jgi:hypothetical protein
MSEQDSRWNEALDIFSESISKPDHEIRAALRDAQCCNELHQVRTMVYGYLRSLRK